MPRNDGFSEERTDIMRFKALDGNHRVEAAKKIFGSYERINYHVYYEFPSQESKIIADGERETRARARRCMM